MKQQRSYFRANSNNPAYQLPNQILFYPDSYTDASAAIADIANLVVILYLHGSGEKGTHDVAPDDPDADLDLLYNNAFPNWLQTNNKEGYLVVCPQVKYTYSQWNDLTFDRLKAMDMLDLELSGAKAYIITGFSMGGQGVWNFVAGYLDKFDGAAVVAGSDDQAITDYGTNPTSPVANTAIADFIGWSGTLDTTHGQYTQSAINKLTTQSYPNSAVFASVGSFDHGSTDDQVYVTQDLFWPWVESIIPNDTIDRDSGFTFTNTELLAWRDRAINGPYKTTGDKVGFTQSPGSWDDVVTRADAFMNDEVTEYWDGVFYSTSQADAEAIYSKGHYLLAAAFYGLIKEDNTYRQKAKTAILTQIANTSNPNFEAYIGYASLDNGFHFANFTTRLFYAFDYTYDLWTAQEIADFEIYMERATALWRDIRDHYPTQSFPNRESDDYSVVSGWAQTGEKYSDDPNTSYYDDKEYTHTDDLGVHHNLIRRVHRWGNGAANLMLADFLWALYKGNGTRINQAKRWIKEWLMFAVWPDGMTSEGLRNDYSRASTGVHYYGAIVLEQVLQVTEQLRRRGDTELYQYTTSDGIWGSEGGNKNIKLVIDTLIENMQSDVERYFWLVQEDRRLVPLNGTFRFKPEMAIARANLYYNDPTIKAAYKNQLANQFQYNAAYGGPTYTFPTNGDLNFWVGNAGTDVALPLQVYEMEGVVSVTQNKGGIRSILLTN